MHKARSAMGFMAVGAVATLLVSGCSGGTTSDAGGELTIALTSDISGYSMDNQPTAGGWFADSLYDYLVNCDENGELSGRIADEWEISDDLRTFTFHIREGMEFTDGNPVDTESVEASFVQHGTSNSRFEGITFDVQDDYNMSLTFPATNPGIAQRMCDAEISSAENIASGNMLNAPVGSGPYTLDTSASTRGSVYTLTKKPDYWDADSYSFDKLVFRVYASETAAINALNTNQVDAMQIAGASVEAAESAGADILELAGGNTLRMILSDHEGAVVPALADPRVRQAMNMVFDREAMATQLFRGQAEPADQIFRPGSDAYIEFDEEPYPYDVEAAKALMAEAGYADGFAIPVGVLPGNLPIETVLPYVTEQLALLNIAVEQTTLSGPSALDELLRSGKFPTPVFQLGNFDNSMRDIEDYVLSTGLWNIMHQDDAEIDRLWDLTLTGTDEEKLQAQQDINQYVTDQAWFIPMINPFAFFAYNPEAVSIPTVSDSAKLHPLLRDFTQP